MSFPYLLKPQLCISKVLEDVMNSVCSEWVSCRGQDVQPSTALLLIVPALQHHDIRYQLRVVYVVGHRQVGTIHDRITVMKACLHQCIFVQVPLGHYL